LWHTHACTRIHEPTRKRAHVHTCTYIHVHMNPSSHECTHARVPPHLIQQEKIKWRKPVHHVHMSTVFYSELA
jgi:hypothetical protein